MALVLLIEDDFDLRQCLAEMLVLAGHQVVEASDGLNGIEHFHKVHPDVVLTDISMPGKGGLDVIRELSLQFPESSIIAMSGEGQEVLGQARRLGACRTLSKPFSFTRLSETLHEMCSATLQSV